MRHFFVDILGHGHFRDEIEKLSVCARDVNTLLLQSPLADRRDKWCIVTVRRRHLKSFDVKGLVTRVKLHKVFENLCRS